MRKVVLLACAVITSCFVLTGCDDLKQFTGDSIDSIGGKISEVADDVGEALGLTEPTQVPTKSPKPNKVYEVATPKPTRTEEEQAEYDAKVAAIAKKAKDAMEGKLTPTPVPTETADEKKNGKKDKKDKDKTTPTPVPTEAEISPTEEPTKAPTATPTPEPTKNSEITPGGGVADW